jgi:hypothetical protein
MSSDILSNRCDAKLLKEASMMSCWRNVEYTYLKLIQKQLNRKNSVIDADADNTDAASDKQ